MSLFIEAEGEAINQKGDILMLAEGMADRLSIKPTEDFGLAVKSSGDGVSVLYMRITDVPATPRSSWNMEILSEDIKSATIEVHTLISNSDISRSQMFREAESLPQLVPSRSSMRVRG